MAVDVDKLSERYGDLLGHLFGELLASNKVTIATAIPGPPLPYLPWYPSDFYGNPIVDAMSDRQQNWYRRLLDKSWQMTEPCFLPKDTILLAGMCRCTPLDLQGDGEIVLARFTPTEDGKFLYHRRLLVEYVSARIPYDSRVKAGQTTAKQRKEGSSPDRSPSSSPESSLGRKLSDNQNQNQNQIKKGEAIPKDLHATNYASILCGQFGITETPPCRQAVIGTVEAAAKFWNVDHYHAYEKLGQLAASAQASGELINHWWFADGKWKKATEADKPKQIPAHLKVRMAMEQERKEKEARVQ